jgi:ankyrin repeat protein
MKPKAQTRILASFAAAIVLGGVFSGCVLFTPPHSAFRPIHQFAEAGDVTNVALDLATNSCDLNLREDAGMTPLALASLHCHTNVMALLLSKHAKVNIKAKGGATALHLAAQSGCVDGLTMLLKSGAKLNARDGNGATPLKRAEEWHQDAAAQLLRANGGKE